MPMAAKPRMRNGAATTTGSVCRGNFDRLQLGKHAQSDFWTNAIHAPEQIEEIALLGFLETKEQHGVFSDNHADDERHLLANTESQRIAGSNRNQVANPVNV